MKQPRRLGCALQRTTRVAESWHLDEPSLTVGLLPCATNAEAAARARFHWRKLTSEMRVGTVTQAYLYATRFAARVC